MAYSPTNWVDGTTPVSASNLNKLEQAVSDNADSIDSFPKYKSGRFLANSSYHLTTASGQTTGSMRIFLLCMRGASSGAYANYLCNYYGYDSARNVVIDLGTGSSAITCKADSQNVGVIVTTGSNYLEYGMLSIYGSLPSVTLDED